MSWMRSGGLVSSTPMVGILGDADESPVVGLSAWKHPAELIV
jgi:hypothetical protein